MGIPKGGVAFFDSGIGGITVLAECKRLLPHGLFYYYGDNAHAPYGNLPPKKIMRYVLRAFRRFRRLRVRAVVLACNTATAVCVERLRGRFSFPIIGTEPAVYPAASKGGEVLVLSTRATYESQRFQKLCARAAARYPQATISAYPCDGLAGAIERALPDRGVLLDGMLPQASPDFVVLGCTHYVYIREQISKFYGCPTVDGNRGVALRLRSILTDHAQPLLGKTIPRKGKMQLKNFDRGGEKSQNYPLKRKKEEGKFSGVFFLGGQKKLNKRVYEQMFAIKVVKKG